MRSYRSYRSMGIALLTGALLLAGFAGNALALTEACTAINNKASLTYDLGAGEVTLESSEAGNTTTGVGNGTVTTFNVATKVDLTVTGGSDTHVIPGATDQVITYSITNTGNDQQRYNLRVWAAAGTEVSATHTDNFNMTNVDVYTDSDNNYGNGGTSSIATNVATDGTDFSGYTAVVEPNSTIYVHLVADVPATRVNGDAAVYALQARTHQPTGLNGGNDGNAASDGGETDEDGTQTQNGCGNVVVLADDDNDSTNVFEAGTTDLFDDAGNGDDYAVGVYYVAAAAISVKKEQTPLWDPINGAAPNAKPIPGAYVTYTLTITNGGVSSATLSQIVDDLQVDLDLDVDFFDGSDATPLNGPYTLGSAGDTVKIDFLGGTNQRPDGEGTAANSGTDQDGVEYTSNPGGVVTVYFTNPGGEGSVMPAGTWNAVTYTEGELKPGESVAISFNVIIK